MTNTSRLPLWRIALWSIVALLLLAPLVATQLTREVNWGPADFALAACLLIGGAALFELVMWKARSAKTRIAIGAAILLAIALVWAEAAVGLFH